MALQHGWPLAKLNQLPSCPLLGVHAIRLVAARSHTRPRKLEASFTVRRFDPVRPHRVFNLPPSSTPLMTRLTKVGSQRLPTN